MYSESKTYTSFKTRLIRVKNVLSLALYRHRARKYKYFKMLRGDYKKDV